MKVWLQLNYALLEKTRGKVVGVFATELNIGWIVDNVNTLLALCTCLWMFTMQLPSLGACLWSIKSLFQVVSLPHRLFLKC
jgi:Zn-dependent membrane protease YugP